GVVLVGALDAATCAQVLSVVIIVLSSSIFCLIEIEAGRCGVSLVSFQCFFHRSSSSALLEALHHIFEKSHDFCFNCFCDGTSLFSLLHSLLPRYLCHLQ